MKVIIFCLLIIILGCSEQRTTDVPNNETIKTAAVERSQPRDWFDKYWQFTQIKQLVITAENTEQLPYVSFTIEESVNNAAEKGQIRGWSGCNRFFGGFEVTKQEIKISSLASTKMMCEKQQPTEHELLSTLEKVSRIKPFANTLLLMNDAEEVLLVAAEFQKPH